MTACPSCQNPVSPQGLRFCINCGTELVPEKTAPLPGPDDPENAVVEEGACGMLIGFKPTGERTTFALDQVESSIGKAPHNRIVLDDPTVSASHALVRLDRRGETGYHILDLASRNGTYVNGRRLSNQTHPLRHGDRIQIGQVMLTFRLPDGLKDREGDEARTTSLSTAPVSTREHSATVSGPQFERTITVNLPREIRQAIEAGRPEPAVRRHSPRRPANHHLKAALLNSTSRIVSTLLGAALTIGLALYLTRQSPLPVRQTPPIPTSGMVSIVAEGTWTRLDTGLLEDDFEASGVTSRPGTGGMLLAGERYDDRLFWLELDETGRQAGPLTPVPVATPGAFHDAEALTYGNGLCYLLSSQSDPIDPRQHQLLRFEFDPSRRAIGNIETIESLRERLLNNIPEIATLGARPGSVGGLNAEGLAWDPNQERLLLGLRSPLIGDQALLVPMKLREPRGPFTAENLELPAPALILLPLGGQGIRDLTYDPRLKSFLILSGPPENRPSGDFSLWEWNGRNEARPRRLLVLEPAMQPEGLVNVTISNQDFLIVTGNGGHYLKLGYREE